MLGDRMQDARWLLAPLAALVVGCGSDGGADPGPAPGTAAVEVVSSRPDMVSQGNALVRLQLPAGAAAQGFRVTAGGRDVTAAFQPAADGSHLGLVDGLPEGASTIVLTPSAGAAPTSVAVRNHARNGPALSGPHQTPWLCETEAYRLPDGSTLGPAQDNSCNAPSKTMYLYMPKDGSAFKPLPAPTALPADMATTTTSEGRTVNYIVRFEVGTLNRAIYQMAVLFDPTRDAAQPLADYRGWNRKLIFSFGGSAASGYRQGTPTSASPADILLDPSHLGLGYAVVSSSLNVFGNNANDVLSAETASMVKEKFIETFGVPLYTMGWGGSGGSMQQHLIANNYPGLLDGITPGYSFPDLHSIVPGVADCALLDRAFTASAQDWTPAQKTAVSGFNRWETCVAWTQQFSPGWLQARQGNVPLFPYLDMQIDLNNCGLALPRALTYDPVSNPAGARCDLYSGIRNLVGIDPATGFAARGYDNVGVQYGLQPFLDGRITAEQFVELNERMGGYDGDGNFQAARTTASALALENLYRFGRLNQAAHLGAVPIIDNRADPGMLADVHDAVRSMSTRARLVRAQGHADNQVILRAAMGVPIADEVRSRMDAWLMAMHRDARTHASAAAKVVANKPAGLVDACMPTADRRIEEPADADNRGQCGLAMPYFADPRRVAGAPLANDVLKCQRKALRAADYPGLSAAQFDRLAAVFPAGVCDYTLPGVGSQPLVATWLAFSAPGVAAPLADR